MKELSKIPILKLNTERIATAAEVGGCYCFRGRNTNDGVLYQQKEHVNSNSKQGASVSGASGAFNADSRASKIYRGTLNGSNGWYREPRNPPDTAQR